MEFNNNASSVGSQSQQQTVDATAGVQALLREIDVAPIGHWDELRGHVTQASDVPLHLSAALQTASPHWSEFLAHLGTDGIAANLNIGYLGALDSLIGRTSIDNDPWSVSALTMAVLAVISQPDPAFDDQVERLGGGLRAARAIADQFDRYNARRPSMVVEWEKGNATLAPELGDVFGRGVSGRMHHDRAFQRGEIVLVHPDQPDRGAVLALVPFAGQVGPARSCLRTRHVRERLQETTVRRIRAATMADQE